MKKLAVIFPGIGYHKDKPLLYYSSKLAREAGYEILEVSYKNFPPRIRGDREKMKQALDIGLAQAEEALVKITFSSYDNILFISKSIGTTIACVYAGKYGIPADHLWYTPLAETILLMDKKVAERKILAFHGTADPWADTDRLGKLCKEHNIDLLLTEGGNHSLETGHALQDLGTLENVMRQTFRFVNISYDL